MFTDYPLHARVLKALANKGFTEPTPIQSESLEHSLTGKDILGQARTGTGKTLAFGLPIAHHLEADKRRGRAPRAFVLTPTRELALQVASELNWIASHLEVVTVYGGTGYGQQASSLKRGADIVVATPGRAIDYMNRNILNLSNVEIAVLDEADEMLSMGFSEDVETLLGATRRERQTMLFSATLARWAKKLSQEHLQNPVHINVMKEEQVIYKEIAIEANLKNRLGILSDVLHSHHGDKAIIFTQTKAETDRLAKDLSARGHGAEAIHGDLNQSQRERAIGRFRAGQVTALIGTNVAARGLDIPEVDLVVHYRIPNEAEAYQHRSGRTGRAGREGTVVILYGPKERRELQMLERAVSRRFIREDAPSPEDIQERKFKGLIQNARNQSEEDKSLWYSVAKDIINQKDSETLAGLFAMLLGGVPDTRSLLTGEEGWLTLEISGRVNNVAQVVRRLKEVGVRDLGRIQLFKNGAYADVRPDEVESIALEGLEIEKATTPLKATMNAQSDKPRRDNRGGAGKRFDRGSRSGGRGKSRKRRGGAEARY